VERQFTVGEVDKLEEGLDAAIRQSTETLGAQIDNLIANGYKNLNDRNA
jgi:hypothetical protein